MQCLVLCVQRTCPIINPVVSSTMHSDCTTRKHIDLHSDTCIHLSQLCFNRRMSWLVYCGLLVSKRVMCHMAGMESSVL